jgi:hypothetical protein
MFMGCLDWLFFEVGCKASRRLSPFQFYHHPPSLLLPKLRLPFSCCPSHQLESAQSYVEQKRTQQGSKKSQVADHSVMVVGELKSSLINATKSFKVRLKKGLTVLVAPVRVKQSAA